MHLRTLLTLSAILALGTGAAFARDPNLSTGVGGTTRTFRITGGSGRSTDDSLAHPGMSAHTPGQVGVTTGGVSAAGGTNKGSSEDFQLSGMGKATIAGKGKSTLDTVPGRSPVYMAIVSGTRTAPDVGGRMP